MMPPMYGNRKMIVGCVVLWMFFLLELKVFACPACSVSDPDASLKSGQSFLILSAMGIIPLVTAAAVAFFIVRFSKREQNS